MVGRLTATDADEGDNGRVTYRARDANEADGALIIDPRTGVIETSKTLDYETTKSLELVVEAVDSGQPAQSSAALVSMDQPALTLAYITFTSKKVSSSRTADYC